MQQQSKEMRSTFTMLPPANMKTSSQISKLVSYKTPINFANPLAEFSLRLAMSHTAKNPYRVHQKKMASV